MNTPEFLNKPYTREHYSGQNLFDFCQCRTEQNPAITERDKELLKQQFPNNAGLHFKQHGHKQAKRFLFSH